MRLVMAAAPAVTATALDWTAINFESATGAGASVADALPPKAMVLMTWEALEVVATALD